MVIPFVLQNLFLRKEGDTQSEISIGFGTQLAYQTALKNLAYDKLLPSDHYHS